MQQNKKQSEIINNLVQNCIWQSYTYVSFQNSGSKQNEQSIQNYSSCSSHLQPETQQNKNSYIQHGDQLYYVGKINGSKPIGIWRIQIYQYCNNKCLVQTIFLKFQKEGKVIMIEQGQVKQISNNLIADLRKILFGLRDPQAAQVSQGQLETIAFMKFKDRVFECQIQNSEEFNSYLLSYKKLVLNDFYFPNMYPDQIPYFKQLRKNQEQNYIFDQSGSQVICFGQYYQGKKNGDFFIKFRDESDSDFKIIGGGFYNANGQKHGKWIKISKNFCKFINLQISIDQTRLFLRENLITGLNVTNLILSQEKRPVKCGKKCRYFDIISCSGGGSYDEQGRQVGAWVEQYDQMRQIF